MCDCWKDSGSVMNQLRDLERSASKIIAERAAVKRAEIRVQMEKVDSPLFTDPKATAGPTIRTFESGAIRSALGNKLQYSGYLNPLVLKRYAEYMKKHQTLPDGSQRAADNWQLGCGELKNILDSKDRHDMDVKLHIGGYSKEATEDLEESLCAVMFNTMAMLKQVMEANGRGNAE